MAKALSPSTSKPRSQTAKPNTTVKKTEAEYQRELRRRRLVDPKLQIKGLLKFLNDDDARAILRSILSLRPDLGR
jgi:hypothetical protein